MPLIFDDKERFHFKLDIRNTASICTKFDARYDRKLKVLVMDGQCENVSDFYIPPPPTLRRVVDVAALMTGNYESHAVRIAVDVCDRWHDQVRHWCKENSFKEPEDACLSSLT